MPTLHRFAGLQAPSRIIVVVNPLLEIQFQVPFDQIRAEHVEPAVQQLARRSSQQTGRAIVQHGSAHVREHSSRAGKANREAGLGHGRRPKHLESVATYPELRAAYNAVQPEVSLFYTNIVLDPGIWRILKEFSETEEAKSSRRVRARFLKKTMDSFRRSGADLDDAGKAKLQAIEVELVDRRRRNSPRTFSMRQMHLSWS